jgi:hypothetical protein
VDIAQGIPEMVTGAERAVASTELLPAANEMPEMAGFQSLNPFGPAAAVGASTLFTSNDETAQIFKANFPDNPTRQDEKGNWILTSLIDGKDYAIKPGYGPYDTIKVAAGLGVGRIISLVSPIVTAVLGEGALATTAGAALTETLAEAITQGVEKGAGGEFDTGNLALAGAIPGAVGALGAGARRLRGPKPPAVKPPVIKPDVPKAAVVDDIEIVSTKGKGKETISAKSEFGNVTGTIKEDGLHITEAIIDEAERGKGHGVQVYTNIIEDSFDKGLRVFSDETVDPGAVRVYESLKRKGYEVIDNREGTLKDGTAWAKGKPVFEVRPKSDKASLKADVKEPKAPVGKALTEDEIVKLASNAAKSGKGKQKLIDAMEVDPSVVRNAKFLDVEELVPIDVYSTERMVKQLTQFDKKQPKSILRGQEVDDLKELGRRMKVMMTDDIGAWVERDTMNDAAQSFMENQTNKLSKKADEVYAEINRKLPDAMPAEAPNIKQYFDDQFKSTGGSPEGLEGLEAQIYNKFFGKNADPITYQALDLYRKNIIGPKTKMSKSLGSGDRGIAKHFYGLITDDQGLAAKPIPELKKLWERGKRLVNAEYSIGENMEKIFGKELEKSLLPKLDQAITGLKKVNSKNLSNLMKSVPPRWRKSVMATGMLDAFGKSIEHGDLNFNNFHQVVKGLEASGTAKNIVYSNLPKGSAKKIKAIGELSGSISETINIKHGFTGASMKDAFDNVDKILNKLFDVSKTIAGRIIVAEGVTSSVGASGAGIMMALGSSVTEIGKKKGSDAVSEVLADPMLKKMIVESVTDKNMAEKTARAFAKRKSMLNFKKHFKFEMSTEEWLLTALRISRQQINKEKEEK